jgi:hypothetical protein
MKLKMKLKTKLSLMSAFAALLAGTSAFAQHGVGNSSGAVIINGKYYLSDLVEAGIQDTDYQQEDAGDEYPDGAYRYVVDNAIQALNGFGNNPNIKPETFKYLGHILKKLPAFEAVGISLAIQSFNWTFPNQFTLNDLDDAATNLKIDVKDRAQLANRYGQTIEILSTIWSQMTVYNQVATILHEAIYASLTPLNRADGTQYQEFRSAAEMVPAVMDIHHQFNDAMLSSFAFKGLPKIDFLKVGEVDNLTYSGESANSMNAVALHQFGVTYNLKMTMSVTGADGKIIRDYTETHAIDATTAFTKTSGDFGVTDWCNAAIAAEWKKLTVENSESNLTLGLIDYQDENQVYKKYFGIVKNEVVSNLGDGNSNLGKVDVLLKGKTAAQCENELLKALNQVLKPMKQEFTH